MATLEDTTEMVNLTAMRWMLAIVVVAGGVRWTCTLHLVAVSQPRMGRNCRNKVEMKRLQELAKRISTVPEAVEMQSRVAKIYGDRQA